MPSRPIWIAGLLCSLMLTVSCKSISTGPMETDATIHTQGRNSDVARSLDLNQSIDFERAERGLIAALAPGEVVYPNLETGDRTLADWSFLRGDAPSTVHPSLWRQSKLNYRAGLYEVTSGIYQLRGFDLANMTLIEGEKGWIVVDPLTTAETARDALAFARKHLGDLPVTAIIYTHSHADHFGGVLGVLTSEEARTRDIPIVAPVGFMDASTKENLVAGPAMLRRVGFVYGHRLDVSPTGHVGIGLGAFLPSGAAGVLVPTVDAVETGQRITLDGVEFEIQMASGSEAPSELMFYLPEKQAFCGAEVVSQTMHNIYTLRGAKTRDALAWSNYIDEAIRRFPASEVYFGSHHWPVWGQVEVREYLEGHRDLYKYLHDQTLRMANLGMTPDEIAEEFELPDALAKRFDLRGYYGSIKHNVKAVYAFYFGWYDGNPAHLDPVPRSTAAARYVELAGGAESMMAVAQTAYDTGDYRWAAEILNHLVFAESGHRAARTLLAKTYQQLGYQSESTQWRNSYLTGALELEEGVVNGPGLAARASETMLLNTPVEGFFETMAVSLDGIAAAEEELSTEIRFTDLGRTFTLEVKDGVLHHREEERTGGANATLEITHPMFLRMLTGQASTREILFSGEVKITGSKIDAARFFRLFKTAGGNFNIVTP